MCGFAGLLVENMGAESAAETVRVMADTLVHRGPDDSGVWSDESGRVAFGFRRLAIIDLSEHGHQPMSSKSGRFTMVFNGEVYNYRALRQEVEAKGHRFRGTSDTEVILAAFEEWGIAETVPRLEGMFAIAAWDSHRRTVTLARDRLGIKPLFVYRAPGVTAFGSELKALTRVPGFDRSVDQASVADLLRYLYVPAPYSIYRSVTKLMPGHMVTLRSGGEEATGTPYWSVSDVAARGRDHPFSGSAEEAVDALEVLIRDAVSSRMYADVPIGAFLSGGIDSSTVVAFMQESASRPVRTFSVAFDEARFNEADDAARIARHIGTDHTEMMLTGADALAVVPNLPDIFDEPHADTSQVPAYLMCKAARDHVTVALSGDGGDEVFGGYNRYTHGERLLTRVGNLPRPVRRAGAGALTWLSPEFWDRVHGTLTREGPGRLKHVGDKVHKVGRVLSHDRSVDGYRSLLSSWPDPAALVPGAKERADGLDAAFESASDRRLIERMMLADQLTYLPDDQLAKVDRVSMATSLEVRVPLIDRSLVEFAWSLPVDWKARPGVGKWILREVLYRKVPRELMDRPKMGLSVPLGGWLRGALRPWAEDLLHAGEGATDEVLAMDEIRCAWQRLQGGRDEAALGLWSVLMFKAWQRRWQ